MDEPKGTPTPPGAIARAFAVGAVSIFICWLTARMALGSDIQPYWVLMSFASGCLGVAMVIAAAYEWVMGQPTPT
jgi:hypothetical protein